MSHEKKSQIKEFLGKNALAISVQVTSVAFFVLNLWLTSQLAPLAGSIVDVEQRVVALEAEMKASSADHIDMKIIKDQVVTIKKDIEEIKGDIKYLIRR